MQLETEKVKTLRQLRETVDNTMTFEQEMALLNALEVVDRYTNLSVFQANLKGVLTRKNNNCDIFREWLKKTGLN